MNRYLRKIALLPLILFIAASIICGALLESYSHREHPLALLGAVGTQDAWAFNASAFLLPGLLAVITMWTIRSGLPTDARWQARIGVQLALLSAIAFAAQGLLPLDPDDLGGIANARHALAWTIWWMSFLAGAVLLSFAQQQVRGFRLVTAAATVAVGAFALLRWPGVMAAFAPRLAFVTWLVWIALAARLVGLKTQARPA